MVTKQYLGIRFLIGNDNHRLDILFSPKDIFIVIMNLEAYLLDFEREKTVAIPLYISMDEFQKP